MTKFEKQVRGIASTNLFPCSNSNIGSQYSCQHYKADWEGRSDIKTVLVERMKRVR